MNTGPSACACLVAVQFGSVARARPLQPRVIAINLTEIDLLERVVANLRASHFLPIAPGDAGDLLFLAIRCCDQPVFGDLEITPALDASGGRRGRGNRQEYGDGERCGAAKNMPVHRLRAVPFLIYSGERLLSDEERPYGRLCCVVSTRGLRAHPGNYGGWLQAC